MKYSRQQLAAQYQNLLADIYQGCAEPSPAVLPPEMQIQSWWASGLLPLHGVCQNGDNVRILERGRWNRLPGPDFTHAEIELSGTRLRGDIEIDSRAQDWEAHGHGANPAFDNVVLHVVLTPPPLGWYTRTSQHKEVPIMYLPPEAWQEATGTSKRNDDTLPRCRKPLAEMNAAAIERLLRAAAAYRQEQKRKRFHHRLRDAGEAQAWYEAWATTLGYSANKEAMRMLAMRVPLRELSAESEALLLGTAGFLKPVLPEQTAPEARSYHRRVWDAWWLQKERYALSPGRELPWCKAPARPLNHPQRRVAALAASASKWNKLQSLFSTAGAAELKKLLSCISHPFWDTHYTLTAAPMRNKASLIGLQRINDFLVNHVYVYDESPAAWESYLHCNSASMPHETMRTAQLLFGERPELHQLLRKAYAQQALLQIDADFCACNICMDCAFPAQLCQWAH